MRVLNKEGADNLGKLLAAKVTGNLDEVIGKISKIILPEDKTCEII